MNLMEYHVYREVWKAAKNYLLKFRPGPAKLQILKSYYDVRARYNVRARYSSYIW